MEYVVFDLEKIKVVFRGSYEECCDYVDIYDICAEICPEEYV